MLSSTIVQKRKRAFVTRSFKWIGLCRAQLFIDGVGQTSRDRIMSPIDAEIPISGSFVEERFSFVYHAFDASLHHQKLHNDI